MPTYLIAPGAPVVRRRDSKTNLSPGDVANDGVKTISGHVRDTERNLVAGATVLLFREADNFFIGSVLSQADGTYEFPRDTTDDRAYYTVAFSIAGGSVQVHGTSDRGLVPRA